MITNNVVTSHSVLAGNETQRNGNVEFDNIPEELKDLTIWYVWGWQERSGKRTKPPLDVNRQCEYFGRTSGEGHEKTLTSYYAAVEFLKQHHGKTLKVWSGWDRKQKRYRGRVDVEVGGIGFKLIGDYCGLDLDK